MKKGFTMVELLAVVTILAAMSLIAFTSYSTIIKNTEISTEKDLVKTIIYEANILYNDYVLKDKQNQLINKDIYDLIYTENKPSDGVLTINEYGDVKALVLIENRCYKKDYDSNQVELIKDEECDFDNYKPLYKDIILNGADPELDEGMIPVIIASDGSLTKANLKEEWYNYASKNWANIVLVTDESRNKYIESKPGTEINVSDILAYYVWIPRYKYKIFTDVDNLENVGSITGPEEYVNKAQIINIQFENKRTSKSNGSNKGEWLTHPAFTFGNSELNGIWVGKFETTGTASKPTVLGYDSRYTETSNITSLRSQNVSTQFLTSGKINYGLSNKEASMLKNMEWGAVAYLSASVYGQGTTEVMINNSSTLNTGCAATVAPTISYGGYNEQNDHTEGYYAGCENEWYTTNGQKASTTGNIYGIYDMSGGAWEYVMGVMEDTNGNPASGRNNDYNSGFTGSLTYPNKGSDPSITSITGNIFPNEKYFDIYSYSTSHITYERGILGDATYELDGFANWVDPNGGVRYRTGWHQDYAHFIYHSAPWFLRGGGYYNGASSGAFAFYPNDGRAHDEFTFRSVLR